MMIITSIYVTFGRYISQLLQYMLHIYGKFGYNILTIYVNFGLYMMHIYVVRGQHICYTVSTYSNTFQIYCCSIY